MREISISAYEIQFNSRQAMKPLCKLLLCEAGKGEIYSNDFYIMQP